MSTPVPLWEHPPGTISDHSRAQDPAATEQPMLVPFLASGERRSAIIVCPGGGYYVRAAHEADPIALWLNALGISAFVLHYRVAPYRHPVPLHDAQRAIRTVRAHADVWGIDPHRIGMLGFSAGGHLACSAANFGDDGLSTGVDAIDRVPSRLQACIACYAVITMGEHRHHGSMVALLGEHPDPLVRQQLSLETSTSPRNPPTFIWHTADDQAVPVQNAMLYASSLLAQRVPVALHIYPHAPHGIGLGTDFRGSARTWTMTCAEWLWEIGFR